MLILGRPEGYTLNELAKTAEMEPRTVRSWINEGLVPGPVSKGRNAVYPPEAMSRLLAAKRLREEDRMTIGDIRNYLASASNKEIDALARGRPLDLDPGVQRSVDSPADYIRSVRSEWPGLMMSEASFETEASDEGGADIDEEVDEYMHMMRKDRDNVASREEMSRLVREARSMLGMETIPSKARSENWTKIAVNPGVNIEVQGDLDSKTRYRYERLADVLREWLARGFGT
jgi:DNA-binding transcriptional MerR regulator